MSDAAMANCPALDAAPIPFHPAPMTDKPQPQLGEHGKKEAARREKRLAAALRDNLRKRKQQVKLRDEKPASKEND
jgi:hypothetical protein